MSELGILEMLFMHVIIGISIFVIVNVVVVIIFSSFLLVGTFFFLSIADGFRDIANIVEEFFYPIPKLPEDVEERIGPLVEAEYEKSLV